MKISTAMVNHYLSDITVAWFNHHELPPDEMPEYLPLVQWMKQNASNHDDLEYLKLAFEYLLTHEDFSGSRYPYDSDDIIEIIDFIYRTIWSDLPPVSLSNSDDVQLVSISLDDWWASREQLPELITSSK
jgi:hypothetical protein